MTHVKHLKALVYAFDLHKPRIVYKSSKYFIVPVIYIFFTSNLTISYTIDKQTLKQITTSHFSVIFSLINFVSVFHQRGSYLLKTNIKYKFAKQMALPVLFVLTTFISFHTGFRVIKGERGEKINK